MCVLRCSEQMQIGEKVSEVLLSSGQHRTECILVYKRSEIVTTISVLLCRISVDALGLSVCSLLNQPCPFCVSLMFVHVYTAMQ